MTNDYSLTSILNVLLSWKRAILLSVISVGIIAAVLSMLKPDYYKAETVFYPANPSLADPSQLGYNASPMYVYGGSDDLDRLFSIVTSERMIRHLIDTFDLFQHYGQDSTTSKGRFKMEEMFRANYKAIKSKYGALILEVEDTDPQLAATIANHARIKAEEMVRQFIKNAQSRSLESYRHNIAEQTKVMVELQDSIRRLKSAYNLIQADYQQRVFSEELVSAIAAKSEAGTRAQYFSKFDSKQDSTIKYKAYESGYASKIATLQEKISQFNNKISILLSAEQTYSRASDQASIMRERERLMMAAYNTNFTAIHLVDAARVPEVKSRPKRAIIVLLAVLIAFVASVTGVLMIHSFRQRQA